MSPCLKQQCAGDSIWEDKERGGGGGALFLKVRLETLLTTTKNDGSKRRSSIFLQLDGHSLSINYVFLNVDRHQFDEDSRMRIPTVYSCRELLVFFRRSYSWKVYI